MSVYVLAQLDIHDRVGYGRYARQFMDTLVPFNGRLLAVDERPEVVEGTWSHDKIVLIEFDSRDEAERWWTSPEYERIAIDRLASSTAIVVVFQT